MKTLLLILTVAAVLAVAGCKSHEGAYAPVNANVPLVITVMPL